MPTGHTRTLRTATVVAMILAGSSAIAADWPDGDIVYEKSRSPDGHYAIVIPSREAGMQNDSDAANYLADLTKHQLLGKIDNADYFEGQNHRGLDVAWAPDSKWCVATYEDRFGFGSIFILEPKGSKFRQTNIGNHIDKELNAVIAKQAHSKDAQGDGSAYFRFRTDRKLIVRAFSQTNPKSFEGVPTYYAFFEGTFELDSKKWTVSRARQVSGEFDELTAAYADATGKEVIVIKDPSKEKEPEDFTGTVVSSEEEKAEYIEKEMNDDYQAARFALSPARFAKVKQDQIAWLKKRDALSSVEEKCKLTEARIKYLQDLLW